MNALYMMMTRPVSIQHTPTWNVAYAARYMFTTCPDLAAVLGPWTPFAAGSPANSWAIALVDIHCPLMLIKSSVKRTQTENARVPVRHDTGQNVPLSDTLLGDAVRVLALHAAQPRLADPPIIVLGVGPGHALEERTWQARDRPRPLSDPRRPVGAQTVRKRPLLRKLRLANDLARRFEHVETARLALTLVSGNDLPHLALDDLTDVSDDAFGPRGCVVTIRADRYGEPHPSQDKSRLNVQTELGWTFLNGIAQRTEAQCRLAFRRRGKSRGAQTADCIRSR